MNESVEVQTRELLRGTLGLINLVGMLISASKVEKSGNSLIFDPPIEASVNVSGERILVSQLGLKNRKWYTATGQEYDLLAIMPVAIVPVE